MIELSNCVWIPATDLHQEELVDLEKKLTAKVRNPVSGEVTEVVSIREDREGYIGLPRSFGLKLISKKKLKYTDKRTPGKLVPYRKQPVLRTEQIGTVEAMLQAVDEHSDFMVLAGTGKGKTVMGLYVAAELQTTCVVLVDQQNLLDQWYERCVEHLGLRPDEIGIVQGQKKDWKDKKVVICMVQTLVSKSCDLPETFYRYFGLAIFDESHSMGARTYSRALMMFHAYARFGLSATPERPDGFNKLLQWNLGEIEVVLDAELEASNVYIMESFGTYSWSANNSKMASRYVNEIADDGRRNLDLAYAIKWLYESGRVVLAVSDRVEHLCSVMALCEFIGVPREVMGMYAKTETVWRYVKDPRPPRKPKDLWERNTDYTPVKLELVQKTIPKNRREHAKENAMVIFATYGIMTKGVDIPRLSGGIDLTPRAQATQLLGRTLRIMLGKIRPIWITVADRNSFRSLFQLKARIADYLTSNAEIYLWHPKKGRKLLDVDVLAGDLREEIALLRRSKIVTALDGNNTLLTPTTPNDRSN